MGNTKGVDAEISKVADTRPAVFDAKGIVIATFQSVMEPTELSEFFKMNNRSFLVFDLSKESSGVHIVKEEIMEVLFGFLKDFDEERLQEKSDELLQELSSTTVTNTVKGSKGKQKEFQISVDDVDGMSPVEKNSLMNVLIEKGVNKTLSDNDLVLLKKLAI
jgi:hypothetical protein